MNRNAIQKEVLRQVSGLNKRKDPNVDDTGEGIPIKSRSEMLELLGISGADLDQFVEDGHISRVSIRYISDIRTYYLLPKYRIIERKSEEIDKKIAKIKEERSPIHE